MCSSCSVQAQRGCASGRGCERREENTPGRKPKPLCVYSWTNLTKCCSSGLVATAMASSATSSTPLSHLNTLFHNGRLHASRLLFHVSVLASRWLD